MGPAGVSSWVGTESCTSAQATLVPPAPLTRKPVAQRLQHPQAPLDGVRDPCLIVGPLGVVAIADEGAQVIVERAHLALDIAIRGPGRQVPQDPDLLVVYDPLAHLFKADAASPSRIDHELISRGP